MKYQDIENEFNSEFGILEVGYRDKTGQVVVPEQEDTGKKFKQFFKTKMKEAMMEIISEDEEDDLDIPWGLPRNGLRAEQKQRVNEFFEEGEK